MRNVTRKQMPAFQVLISYDRQNGWRVDFRHMTGVVDNHRVGDNSASIEILPEWVLADESISAALRSGSLSEVRKQAKLLLDRTSDLLNQFNATRMIVKTVELLYGKIVCISALANTLEFRHTNLEELDNAREIFRRHGLTDSVKATNCLENFILDFQRYETLQGIREKDERRFLQVLKPLRALDSLMFKSVADGVLEPLPESAGITSEQDVRLEFKRIEEISNDWVRVCLVQLDFALELLPTPQEFGYIVAAECKKLVQQKVMSALEIAQEEKVDVICFPELSFTSEWLDQIRDNFKEIIVVGGTYYQDGFNLCPVIIGGKVYPIRKIHPAPNAEEEVKQGRGMRKGNKILVFQTKFGRFAALVCVDYKEESHLILRSNDNRVRGVDFIINPCYNTDVPNFQQKANQDCQMANFPYILQVNVLKKGRTRCGGTCIIGMDHKSALRRYEIEGYRPRHDPVNYKLLEAKGEMIVIASLDLARKGVAVPSSGFKMKEVSRYMFKSRQWQEFHGDLSSKA